MIAKFKRHLQRIWAVAPVATVLLALALAATLLFGVRGALFWADRHDRIAREQPVAAWMTPRYVAHSWHLPPEMVIEALSLDPRDGPPRTRLSDIAAERGVPVSTIIEALEAAIAEHRAAHPAPGSPPGPPGDAGGDVPPPPPDGEGPGE